MKGAKTGGRAPGTPNRLTREIRETLKALIDRELDQLPALIESLPPDKRLELLIKLLPYVLPRVETVSHRCGEPDRWGDIYTN